VTSDTGYHSNPNTRDLDPRDTRSGGLKSGSGSASSIERPGFKTREEFQRDFERRERELREVLARSSRKPEPPVTMERERDSLGASTRSDPGQ